MALVPFFYMSTNYSLTHPAKNTIKDWNSILDNVNSIDDFDKSIKKHAIKHVKNSNLSDNEKEQISNKFKGDVFEVFAEAFLKQFGCDPNIGINEYRPFDPNLGEKDNGVDGFGIGTNLKRATVQIKWRGNSADYLTDENAKLNKFLAESQNCSNDLKVDVNDYNNMLVITNAKDIHPYTKTEGLKRKVRCLGREQLKHFVDNNFYFWNKFKESVITIPRKPDNL